MATEIAQLDELTLWGRPRPGRVAPWVRVAIVVTAMLSVAIIYAVARGLRDLDARPLRWTWWQRNGAATMMLAAVAIVYAPPSRLSRSVRLAIALPMLHAIAIVVATVMYGAGQFHVARGQAVKIHVPMHVVVLGMGVATFAAAGLLGRRRREVAHVAVALALTYLLLLGLWLPIVADVAGRRGYDPWSTTWSFDGCNYAPLEALAVIALPPFVVACACTALAHRLRGRLARLVIGVAVAGLFAAAVRARWTAKANAQLVYETFAFVVLAALAIAIVAVIALGATTWLASRRDRRELATFGRPLTIKGPGEGLEGVVACIQVTSWLRGPRMLVRPFVAASPRGDVAVDARLATALPLSSTVLRTNEAVVVLREGDAVEVAGFETRPRQHGNPYRDAAVDVPGPRGLVVGATTPASTPMQSFALATWRPSVAYLVIAAVVMVPALIGLVVR